VFFALRLMEKVSENRVGALAQLNVSSLSRGERAGVRGNCVRAKSFTDSYWWWCFHWVSLFLAVFHCHNRRIWLVLSSVPHARPAPGWCRCAAASGLPLRPLL